MNNTLSYFILKKFYEESAITLIIYVSEANTSLCSGSQTEIHLWNIPWKGRFDSLHFASGKKKNWVTEKKSF